MKDLSGVLVNGDSSSVPASSLSTASDDDYVFTEDQRRAALELQSLYRKLGLEDLDDGFEEGLSAYDDPHFDIVARLQEVNSRFEEDETPLDSDRQRKVRFKETLVDLVVPISPVRSSSTPPEFDYAEYDDEYYDDFETEELEDMMAENELKGEGEDERYGFLTDEDKEDEKEDVEDEREDVEDEREDVEDEREDVEDEKENVEVEKENIEYDTEKPWSLNAVENKESAEQPPSATPLSLFTSDFHENESNRKSSLEGDNDEEVDKVDDEDDDHENIHIRQISSVEREDAKDDSDRSDCSSPEKMVKLEIENPSLPYKKPETNVDVPSTFNTSNNANDSIDDERGSQMMVANHSSSPEDTQQSVVAKSGNEQLTAKGPPKESSSVQNGSKKEKTQVPTDQPSATPLGAKPKKPSRMTSPPCKPRPVNRKPATLGLRPSVPVDTQPQVIKCGNSRSRYGLTEELRQELSRLKQLEAAQKKLREQEHAEEKRRKQEEAESAFRAWLEMKKKSRSSSSASTQDSSNRSPSKKAGSAECAGKGSHPAAGEEHEEAFQAWLEQKRLQENRQKMVQQLQKQHEMIANEPQRGRRDSSRKAYRAWLRRKNAQRRQQTQQSRQRSPPLVGEILAATYPRSLPRALHQANMINRTYQAYLGSTLWAALAELKRRPATLI